VLLPCDWFFESGGFDCAGVITSCTSTTSENACIGTGGFGCTGVKSSVAITGGNAGGNACVVLELGAFTGVKSSTIPMGENACAISSTTVHVETLTVGCDDDVFDTGK